MFALVGIAEVQAVGNTLAHTQFHVRVIHHAHETYPYLGTCSMGICYTANAVSEFIHTLGTPLTSAVSYRNMEDGEPLGGASRTAFTVKGNIAIWFAAGQMYTTDLNTALPLSVGELLVNKITLPVGKDHDQRYMYASTFTSSDSLRLAVTMTSVSYYADAVYDYGYGYYYEYWETDENVTADARSTDTNISIVVIEAFVPFVCMECPPNHYCPKDTLPVQCPELYVTHSNLPKTGDITDCSCTGLGTWESQPNLCALCSEEFYCPGYNVIIECPVDSVSIPRRGSSRLTNCEYIKGYYYEPAVQHLLPCPPDYYCIPTVGSFPEPCPPNSNSLELSWRPEDCICDSGTYYREDNFTECILCPINHYCVDSELYPCPGNKVSEAGSSVDLTFVLYGGKESWESFCRGVEDCVRPMTK